MRIGFVLGFLIGGAIATLLGKPADSVDGPSALTVSGSGRTNPLKQHVDEARDAAKEAQLEKESELLRLYDAMVHRKEAPEG